MERKKFVCLYRSSQQFPGIFETFADNFELNLDALTDKNPFLITFLDDFNAKGTTWCNYDTTSYEVCKIEAITSHFGIQKIIKEPSHLIGNSSSCVNLIFASQPNLVIESSCSLLSISKLLPSDSICKIEPKNSLPTTLRMPNLTLLKRKFTSCSKILEMVFLGK